MQFSKSLRYATQYFSTTNPHIIFLNDKKVFKISSIIVCNGVKIYEDICRIIVPVSRTESEELSKSSFSRRTKLREDSPTYTELYTTSLNYSVRTRYK